MPICLPCANLAFSDSDILNFQNQTESECFLRKSLASTNQLITRLEQVHDLNSTVILSNISNNLDCKSNLKQLSILVISKNHGKIFKSGIVLKNNCGLNLEYLKCFLKYYSGTYSSWSPHVLMVLFACMGLEIYFGKWENV